MIARQFVYLEELAHSEPVLDTSAIIRSHHARRQPTRWRDIPI